MLIFNLNIRGLGPPSVCSVFSRKLVSALALFPLRMKVLILQFQHLSKD